VSQRTTRIDEANVRALAIGCSILGAGGGGDTPTLTDAVVAADRAAIGDRPSPAEHTVMLSDALTLAEAMLADAVDRAKTTREPLPLIAVGGASALVSDRVPGVREVHRRSHHDVANAIGAAIAAVSGEVEEIPLAYLTDPALRPSGWTSRRTRGARGGRSSHG
jgi:hypothetical protein